MNDRHGNSAAEWIRTQGRIPGDEEQCADRHGGSSAEWIRTQGRIPGDGEL